MLRYAITDRRLLAPEELAAGIEGEARLLERCRLLAFQGVDFIQLREKDLPKVDLMRLAAKIVEQLHTVRDRSSGSHTRLLINADPAAAVSIGADGVHLTSTSHLKPLDVISAFREARLPQPTVSVSCHTLAEVERARGLQATLILFGPVFGKCVRGRAVASGVGLGALADACRAARPTPVLALGGVTQALAPACLAAGAAGIAAIRSFMLAPSFQPPPER